MIPVFSSVLVNDSSSLLGSNRVFLVARSAIKLSSRCNYLGETWLQEIEKISCFENKRKNSANGSLVQKVNGNFQELPVSLKFLLRMIRRDLEVSKWNVIFVNDTCKLRFQQTKFSLFFDAFNTGHSTHAFRIKNTILLIIKSNEHFHYVTKSIPFLFFHFPRQ